MKRRTSKEVPPSIRDLAESGELIDIVQDPLRHPYFTRRVSKVGGKQKGITIPAELIEDYPVGCQVMVCRRSLPEDDPRARGKK